MTIRIVRLTSEEWGRLKQLRLDAVQDSPDAFSTTLEAMESWPDANWCQQVVNLPTYVAMIGSRDVGIARVEVKESTTDAYLISMWVSPTERGRRVGENLVEAVAGWARDTGFARLLLNVVDDNAAAIALYERINFHPTGETTAFPPPRSHISEHRRALML